MYSEMSSYGQNVTDGQLIFWTLIWLADLYDYNFWNSNFCVTSKVYHGMFVKL